MIKRIFSTLFLWVVVLGIPAIMGPQGAVWLLAIITLLTQNELYSLLEKAGFRPQKQLGCVLGFLTILGTWYIPLLTGLTGYNAGPDMIALAVMVISLSVLRHPSVTEARQNIMPTILGIILVPYMLHMYVYLIEYYNSLYLPTTGLLLTVWLIAVAKFTDVGGLLLGKMFGRHKLAPEISPGKTWEGAVGGIAVGAIVGAVSAYLFRRYAPMPELFTPLFAAIVAIPVAVLSIASDLIESVLKRQAGVKDSGHIFPGIGGAFDLMDSLLLSGPAGFLIFKYCLF